MSRVIFMCGPSGSGKSTYAPHLEASGMLRLSFDTELWRRGVTQVPPSQEINEQVEADLRRRLLRAVADERDVVLDFSFSSRAMREDYRALLASTGVVPETVYLATDRDTVMQRLAGRAGHHSEDLVLGQETAARHFDDFEVPTEDEGPLTVVGSGDGGGNGKVTRARLAHSSPPTLRTHDRWGHRVDEVDYHPGYHRIIGEAVAHTSAWANPHPVPTSPAPPPSCSSPRPSATAPRRV